MAHPLIELAKPGTGGGLPSQAELNNDEFLERLANDEIDRWQRFLAAVGYGEACRTTSIPLPGKAIEILRRLRAATEAAATLASTKLLETVDNLLRP